MKVSITRSSEPYPAVSEDVMPACVSITDAMVTHRSLHASAAPAEAAGKEDELPKDLLEVLGGVAAAVAGVTAAVSVGPVAALALPTAAFSAVPLATGGVLAGVFSCGPIAMSGLPAGLHPVANGLAAAATASSLAAAAGEAAAQGAAGGTQSGGRPHTHDLAFGKTFDSSTNKL